MRPTSRLAKTGYAAAGLVAGAALATTLSAHAASSTPTATPSGASSSATEDPHPGDNAADGIPESQEHHGGGPGGGGHALSLSGTVTSVGASSVTIKTSSGTTIYTVTSSSDIDKNGEASLKSLVVGDAVRFSVASSNAKQIDKLHAGDEAKDMPQHDAPVPQSGSGSTAPSGTT
jgi:hypothetical protein